ncbi:MAG TPA: hypothetical protein VH560_06845 [Polyangia bacterium]|jgi:hypothetical protein|nr:hypothetical protein [Polyangia bacterium]
MPNALSTLGLPVLDTRKLELAWNYRRTENRERDPKSIAIVLSEDQSEDYSTEPYELCPALPGKNVFSNARLFVFDRRAAVPKQYRTGIFDTCVLGFSNYPVPASIVQRNLTACTVEFLTGAPVTSLTIPANPAEADRNLIDWISSVRQLDGSGNGRSAVAEVFRGMLNLIEGGSFPEVDAVLGQIEPRSFSTEVALAFLAITSRVRDPLPSRNALLKRVENYLRETRDSTAVEKLLRGL